MAKIGKRSCKFNDDQLKEEEFKPWLERSKMLSQLSAIYAWIYPSNYDVRQTEQKTQSSN